MIENEKNPRFWSSRYWSKNNVSDVLKEVVEPETVDVSSIKMNETLTALASSVDQEIADQASYVITVLEAVESEGITAENAKSIIQGMLDMDRTKLSTSADKDTLVTTFTDLISTI